jgi:polar amino acid transport system substrate-binding protein/arginine/ornithine transport system substrate-binding protein
MKQLRAAMIVGSLLAASQAWAQERVRIATEGAYPPFNFVDASGKPGGFDVDLAEAICAAAKFQCSIVAQEFKGIIPGLLSEKYDLIMAGMNMTPARGEQVLFSKKYAQVPQRFAMNETLAREVEASPGEGIEKLKAGLKGKTIGLVSASAADTFVRERFGNIVTYRAYQKTADSVQDLAAGRVDAVADGAVALNETFLSKPAGKGFRLGGPPMQVGTGIGAAARKSDAALIEKVNAAIDKLRADGTYQRIASKYFNFDVYGQ